MSRASVVVVTAGLRQPSSSRLLGDRLAAAVRDSLSTRGADPEVEVVELREFARDLVNHLLTGFPGRRLADLLDRVAAADGLVMVSPIFSGSYSGLFKTFADVLEPESLVGTPVLVAATGGTARHSLAIDHALRPLFAYLRAVVVPTGVYAAPEDWADPALLGDRIDRAAAELADLVVVRAERRAAPEDDTVVPFAQLLGRLGESA